MLLALIVNVYRIPLGKLSEVTSNEQLNRFAYFYSCS